MSLVDYGVSEYGFRRKTYTEILADMETRARSLFGEDINLTERSPMGLWLRATAWEKGRLWEALENSYLNAFAIHANGIALDWVVSNKGKRRHPAVRAKGAVVFTGDDGKVIPEGFLVSTQGGIYFATTAEVTIVDGVARASILAVEAGSSGNVGVNMINKIINPTAGISSVTNDEPTTDGADVESDMALRERYLLEIREPATGDNVAQYQVWAREVPGVGNVKVKPATPTPGYVRIIISDIYGQPVSTELINQVTAYIESVKPVNAGISVISAVAKTINISAKVRLSLGYTLQSVYDGFVTNVGDYFAKVALEGAYVSSALTGKALFDVPGVVDYSELLLNGTSTNIALGDEEAPVIGDVVLEVV